MIYAVTSSQTSYVEANSETEARGKVQEALDSGDYEPAESTAVREVSTSAVRIIDPRFILR